jgi:hypothetical protein
MIYNSLRWTTSASICLVLMIFAGLQSADAQTKDFNVPAQSATTGIPEFARQAGVQILVSETLVRGKRTAAVTGVLPVEKALVILLAGTGLTANSKDGATFTLSAMPTPATSFNPVAPSPAFLTIRKISASLERRLHLFRQTRGSVSLKLSSPAHTSAVSRRHRRSSKSDAKKSIDRDIHRSQI